MQCCLGGNGTACTHGRAQGSARAGIVTPLLFSWEFVAVNQRLFLPVGSRLFRRLGRRLLGRWFRGINLRFFFATHQSCHAEDHRENRVRFHGLDVWVRSLRGTVRNSSSPRLPRRLGTNSRTTSRPLWGRATFAPHPFTETNRQISALGKTRRTRRAPMRAADNIRAVFARLRPATWFASKSTAA